ncbi:MAG: DNA primase [Alphaproteobacteria bacterium]|nr:MAG: DNA primase [Alphaproteobacteria bacterium]
MARIPEAELERLKASVGLVALIGASGVQLTPRGRDHVGLCPFHEDREPSLSVTAEKGLWRCFGCDAGGDAIAWVMKREGVSFRHAVELLKADWAPDAAAAPVTQSPIKQSTVRKLDFEAAPEDRALLGQVLDYYHGTMTESPEALAYLEKRGLAHPDIVAHFKLGYANRTLGYRLPAANRVAGADIRGRLTQIGILRESGHEHMTGSLVAPIFDENCAPIQMYGRKITDGLRKGTPLHLYLSGPLQGIFNRDAVIASEEIILCEAIIDALTFWAAGYGHVTASFGANGFTDELRAALSAAHVKRVLVAYDRDEAGDRGAGEVADALARHGVAVYRVNFPKGMDANEYARQVQPASKALAALLRSAEWMKGGEANANRAPEPEPVISMIEAAREETPEATADDAPAAKPLLLAAEPATPAPAAPPPRTNADVSAKEITIRLSERTWRARGLAKNASYDALKVILDVRPNDVREGEAYHIDGLDLLNAKSRTGFAAQAAAELGASLDAIKRDLGQVLFALEGLRDEALKAAEEERNQRPAMTPAEEADALELLSAPDLMDRIAADVEAIGIVGEAANAQAAYLAALSRKLDRPLALLIQSTSAAGKSALMDAVLDLVPEEERVAYSAMTGQSLFYLGETDLKHKVLAIAEEEGARHAAYALKLLQSQGTLTIASAGKDPVTGKLVTQEYHVEGPVALMLTTTAIDLDEELKNRCLVLTIDESREQTRAIQARQRFDETLPGLAAKEARGKIIARHQNAQRLLKPLRVVNPYAERLTFLDDKTRTRRDHRKYLTLIRVIALLHQHQRPVRTLERAGGVIDYIEATPADIAAANALAHAIMGATLDELPPQTRRLLGLVHELAVTRANAEGVKPREARFTRRDVREATGWSDTQLKVHLGRLVELEYLFVTRAREGEHASRFVYALAYDGEGADGAPFVMGLLDASALDSENCSYDENRSAQNEDRSGLGRPPVGAWPGGGRGGEIGETPTPATASREDIEATRETPNTGRANGAVPYMQAENAS